MSEVGLDGEGTWAETAKTLTTGHGFDGQPVFVRIERTETDFSHKATADPASFKDTIQLAAIPDSYDFNRGLLLVVQGIQLVADLPILRSGGPSGSRKTSLAYKMANIVGCEVVSLESYYKSEHSKDFKYDDFSSLDLSYFPR
ncbi:hypothetical protein Dimus_023044 [Dionaea muscipula]